MRITTLAADHVRVPLPARGGRVPLSAAPAPAGPDAVDLILVRIETDAGVSGLGFSYVLGPGAGAVKAVAETDLPALLVGEDPRDTDRLFAKAEARFRAVGFAGAAARAYCAADVALWDAKAKAAGVPLAKLLGAARPAAPFFASDIAPPGRDPSEVVKAAKPLVKQGATGVRVEVGHAADVQADTDRVRDIVAGVGEDVSVTVAADGRYDLVTAAALAHFFEDQGIDLFEDPIPAGDAAGYARLGSIMGIPLAVGSGFHSREDFFRVMREGDVRTVRPDPCRLGGITPVLKVAAVAEAFGAAVLPVRMPEVGVHLACGLAAVSQVDAVGWFKDVFAGGPVNDGGRLKPADAPGLGLAWTGRAG